MLQQRSLLNVDIENLCARVGNVNMEFTSCAFDHAMLTSTT
jgi:hypothetical protein